MATAAVLSTGPDEGPPLMPRGCPRLSAKAFLARELGRGENLDGPRHVSRSPPVERGRN